MTLNDLYPGLKVTPFFDPEYLWNGTRYRHSFNWILIGTYTRPHFKWPWVIMSNLAKYSMTQASRGLPATVELFVIEAFLVFLCISTTCLMSNHYHFCGSESYIFIGAKDCLTWMRTSSGLMLCAFIRRWCAVTVSKDVVGMSCGFRDSCCCGYHFVSSNVNLVWKWQLRGGVEMTEQPESNDTVTATGINSFDCP